MYIVGAERRGAGLPSDALPGKPACQHQNGKDKEGDDPGPGTPADPFPGRFQPCMSCTLFAGFACYIAKEARLCREVRRGQPARA